MTIRRGGGGFEASEAPSPGRLRPDEGDAFTVAIVTSSLDAEDSALAFACDFIAIGRDAALTAVDVPMLRRRAGPAVDGSVGPDGLIAGERLHALGLAAFLVDAELEVLRRRILGHAGTLLALKQARLFSCPRWFDPT